MRVRRHSIPRNNPKVILKNRYYWPNASDEAKSGAVMQRNDDLIREILFAMEADDSWVYYFPVDHGNEDAMKHYHALLLEDAGLLAYVGGSDEALRLTSQGHDFINLVRDDGVWKKVKEGAAKAKGASISLLISVAEAYAKQKVTEVTGLPL